MFGNERFIQIGGSIFCGVMAVTMFYVDPAEIAPNNQGLVSLALTLMGATLVVLALGMLVLAYITCRRNIAAEAMERTKAKMSLEERKVFFDLLITNPEEAVDMLNEVEARQSSVFK